MEALLSQLLLLLLLLLLMMLFAGPSSAAVNLFIQPKSPSKSSERGQRAGGGSVHPSSMCETLSLEKFEKLNGTGAKAYKISEKDIQLCPNFCGRSEVVDEFCSSRQPRYVRALGADVKSDRCCDERRCNCVCHFDCRTLRHKEREYKSEGYKYCSKDSRKKVALKKARKKCKSIKKRLGCRKKRMRFLCPRQFFCLQHQPHRRRPAGAHQCLACVNPNCVTKEDKKISKLLLTAQNQTEQHDYLKMLVSRDNKDKDSDEDEVEDISGGIIL